jgi:hypothetical protein
VQQRRKRIQDVIKSEKRAGMSAKVGKRRYKMYILVHDQLFHGRHGCCQDACVGVGLVGRVVGLRDAMSVREIRTERRTSDR